MDSNITLVRGGEETLYLLASDATGITCYPVNLQNRSCSPACWRVALDNATWFDTAICLDNERFLLIEGNRTIDTRKLMLLTPAGVDAVSLGDVHIIALLSPTPATSAPRLLVREDGALWVWTMGD